MENSTEPPLWKWWSGSSSQEGNINDPDIFGPIPLALVGGGVWVQTVRVFQSGVFVRILTWGCYIMSRIYSSYIWDLSWTLVSNTSVFPTWSAGGRPRDSVTHTCRPTFPLTDACEGLPLSLCLLFISQWPSPLHGGTQTSERLLTLAHTHTFHVPNTVYTFTSHTHTLAYRWFHSWLTVCCSGLSVNVREMTVEICPGGEKKVNLGEGAFPTCSAFFFFSPVTTFENTGEYTPEILRRWSHNLTQKQFCCSQSCERSWEN